MFRRGKWARNVLMSLLLVAVVTSGMINVNTKDAHAATSQFKGVNWADARDNFVNGVLYVTGLWSDSSYSDASTIADRVVGQMYSITGANTVRMPINEPTVSSYWGTYTGAIDKALTKGKVILAYWAYSGGKPANTNAFYSMWDTVVNKYGSNPNAYFEVINEPYGYSTSALNNMYNDWLNRYSNVPRGRVILDGAGYAQNVPAVGGDSRLDGTLLGVHDYSFFVNPPYESESQWYNHLAGYVGDYASRTICTEWGAPMSPGSKNGVQYGTQDYNTPGGSYFVDYVRGISSRLHDWGMGSIYWPGLRDGDWYSLTSKSGEGSNITLSLVNASGLDRLHYAWGSGSGGSGSGSSYVRIKNVQSGLFIDGMGRTSNGSAVGQWSDSNSANQQWVIESAGSYVRIKNRATGLYLDGMGRTTNGADAGQWSGSGSNNQQWTQESSGGHVRFKNRATGLYLDGMGRTSNGSNLGQWSNSGSANQQWQISTVN